MKLAVILSSMAMLLFYHDVANACSIQNVQKVQIGDYKGIKGRCSNNGLPISCIFIEGEGISCDGPAGSYSGDDLNSLVFSACGCSTEKEEEKKEKKELKEYK
jgi:hypothetical protein